MKHYTEALKLTPNLFTPLSRTPWAGSYLASSHKRKWASAGSLIGESWEISCDPSFPSKILNGDKTLWDCIKDDPIGMLSKEHVDEHGANCDILVKLINADDPLSVQVHPTDSDPLLKAGECGKPESWLVLHAEPGSGLYLGFSKPLPKSELEDILRNDGDLKPYLQFVPVKEGDFFEIEPGVIHAIGAGVTLLEPQRVRVGKAGKTYRFWDWQRRYNPDGTPNPTGGSPRELHISEGLRLVDSELQVGPSFVASLRRKAEVSQPSRDVTLESYPANPYYQVHRLRVRSDRELCLSLNKGFVSFVCLGGKGTLGKNLLVSEGEPGFVPASALPLLIQKDRNTSELFDLALITPIESGLRVLEI